MKNILNYFYNFNLLDVYNIDNKYYFNFNNNSYIFIKLDRPVEDIKPIYDLYIKLKEQNILTNDIIVNKDNQFLTMVNNDYYVLIKDNSKKGFIDLNDIFYIQNNTMNIVYDKKLYRNNWIKMWCAKIDYYENQMNNFSKKYPLLYNSIDYYIGLGENAISYLVNNKINTYNLILSHRRLGKDTNSFDFYNPINFIVDSKVRDFSEYVKSLFFNNNITGDIFNRYIDYMNYSKEEYILLIARLLFPTYYFDLYDDIINNNKDESIIKNVLDKNNDYINFLKNTFYYIIYVKRINIPSIEWIIKFQN